jgi:hypothetical protein
MDEAVNALRPHAPALRTYKHQHGWSIVLDKEPPKLHGRGFITVIGDEDVARVIAEAVADLTANPL